MKKKRKDGCKRRQIKDRQCFQIEFSGLILLQLFFFGFSSLHAETSRCQLSRRKEGDEKSTEFDMLHSSQMSLVTAFPDIQKTLPTRDREKPRKTACNQATLLG